MRKKEFIKRLKYIGGELTIHPRSFNPNHRVDCPALHSWGSFMRIELSGKDRWARMIGEYLFGTKRNSKIAFLILKEWNEELLEEEDLEKAELHETNKYTRDNKGFIYLIKSGKFYKIGRAKNMSSRLIPYKTENPNKIFLIAKKEVSDYVKTETELLDRYKRFKHRGEWFGLGKKEVREIKEFLSFPAE